MIIGSPEVGKGIDLSLLPTSLLSESSKVQRKTGEITASDGVHLTYEISDNYFEVSEGEDFHFLAWIDKRGNLHLTVNNEVNGEKSKHIFPSKLADYILTTWATKISAIVDAWYPDGGTNITQYSQAIARGETPKQAALSTWTGELAKRHSFKNVTQENGAIFVTFER